MSERTQTLKALRKGKTVPKLTREVIERPVIVSQVDKARQFVGSKLPKDLVNKLSQEEMLELLNLREENREQFDEYLGQVETVREEPVSEVVTDSVIWNSPGFKEEREKEDKYVRMMTVREEFISGVYKCNRCGRNDRIVITQKQTRGGDEGMTSVLSCRKCNVTWTES